MRLSPPCTSGTCRRCAHPPRCSGCRRTRRFGDLIGFVGLTPARTVLRPYNKAADMTGRADDALVLMERAVVSRDPLELALAGFLAAYNGRTFDKQRRVIKHYVDWCIQNDLPPLQAKRPHIELFVRWCETQPWSESYICQHFVGVRSFYNTCVRDEVLLRNPPSSSTHPRSTRKVRSGPS